MKPLSLGVVSTLSADDSAESAKRVSAILVFLTSAGGSQNGGKASRKQPGPGTTIPGCDGNDKHRMNRECPLI